MILIEIILNYNIRSLYVAIFYILHYYFKDKIFEV